jgi:hypothetical protein
MRRVFSVRAFFVDWLLFELVSGKDLVPTHRRSVMVALCVYNTHVRTKPCLERGACPHFGQEKAVIKTSRRHNNCVNFRHFAEHPVIVIGRMEFRLFVAYIPLFPKFEREHEL